LPQSLMTPLHLNPWCRSAPRLAGRCRSRPAGSSCCSLRTSTTRWWSSARRCVPVWCVWVGGSTHTRTRTHAHAQAHTGRAHTHILQTPSHTHTLRTHNHTRRAHTPRTHAHPLSHTQTHTLGTRCAHAGGHPPGPGLSSAARRHRRLLLRRPHADLVWVAGCNDCSVCGCRDLSRQLCLSVPSAALRHRRLS
jgi:hypothetical protein